jgi:hypothetical protein
MPFERLSPNQYATLRSIINCEVDVTLDTVGQLHAGNLRHLLSREFLKFTASGNLRETAAGVKAFNTYSSLPIPRRKNPGEITDYVAMMIGLKRSRAKAAHKQKSNARKKAQLRRPRNEHNQRARAADYSSR